MSEPIRQALILAGGRGTRLGAITEAIPKPMLRIAGDKPFLDTLIEMIERHGYEDILLLGGYLGEVLEAAYDGRRIGRAKRPGACAKRRRSAPRARSRSRAKRSIPGS